MKFDLVLVGELDPVSGKMVVAGVKIDGGGDALFVPDFSRLLGASGDLTDAFAYAVWMVGNNDTDHDKAAWWKDFGKLYETATDRVMVMKARGVIVGEGFERTGLPSVSVPATNTGAANA